MAINQELPKLLQRLWQHLSRRRQHQFVALLCLMLISSFMEVVSLGAVLPFLAVLTDPERVFAYPLVVDTAQTWGITSADGLVLPLTIAFAVAALMAGSLRMFLLWAGMRLGLTSGSDLSIELYRRTLYQPYQVHLARNSSEVIAGITHKVSGVAFGVLQPVLTLISSFILLIAIMAVLVAIHPMAAATAALGFGISYGLIAMVVRRRLKLNSESVAREQTQMVKALQEGLGGIRDVLLDGAQQMYCEIYRKADYPLRRAQSDSQFINASPRYAMEALGMVLMAALAYALIQQDGGMGAALPVLGALALGAQRLLPALQQSYGAWVTIVSCQASLVETLVLLDQPLPDEASQPAASPLVFKDSIHFNKVFFRYSAATPWVLNALDLNIPKGARVGFVGRTGSGKSTMLDLLMGLLLPTEGALLVDGLPVNGRHLRAWQRTIAHVPQSIYLADTTLAENIAFGINKADIDMKRVKQAACQAQIADFIESSADGYEAFVGERGIRLSGGQRQRIGIARALYKQASVLVFDEATSALDNATEQSVMDAIDGLDRDLTILLIAHRLTTVRHCDIIVELDSGKVVAQGTYEQLLESSPSFRAMAQAIDP
jgi:ABC-type multidrug transport system fused ATPase/permease subunit